MAVPCRPAHDAPGIGADTTGFALDGFACECRERVSCPCIFSIFSILALFGAEEINQ